MTQVNSDLGKIIGIDTLVGELKFVPREYLQDPLSYFKLSGYAVEIYITKASISLEGNTQWTYVAGVHDNNNGDIRGSQLALGTAGLFLRTFVMATGWSAWTKI